VLGCQLVNENVGEMLVPMLTMMALMIVDCCMLCTAAHCCLQWLHSRHAATARQWCRSQCAGQRLMATSSLCCLLGPGLLTSPAFCVIYTADIACGSVYVTVQCLSVWSVCLLSVDRCMPWWWICCFGLGGQEMSMTAMAAGSHSSIVCSSIQAVHVVS